MRREPSVTCGAIIATALAACSGERAAPLARAVVDTLPGGIVSVQSPGPTAWRDTNGWKLVESGRIRGEPGEPGELITPISLAADGAGRIYVSDQSPAAIRVFDSSGNFVRGIGREGAGPGEYKSAFIAVRGPYLAVHDPSQSRTSLFDTSGTHIRTWATACCYFMPIGFDEKHRIVVAIPGDARTQRTQRFARYDTLGAGVDTLSVELPPDREYWEVRTRDASMSRGIPFAPQLVRSLDPRGGVLLGWSGDYRIVRSGTGRDTLRVFGREWAPAELDDAKRRAAVEQAVREAGEGWDEVQLRNAFRLSDVPTTLPAFERIEVDAEGNVWVRTDADSLRTLFDVFGPSGEYLGPVRLDGEVSAWGPMAWAPGLMYVAMEDDDGTPEIRRYRIDRGVARE